MITFADYLSGLSALYKAAGVSLPLSRPAAEQDVRALEDQLGVRFPPDLWSAWMTTDGGEEYTTIFAKPGSLTGYDFLSVANALSEREGLRRRAPNYADYDDPRPRDPRIREGWFQAGWLPFARFGGATLLLLLDFTPSAAGTVGQVIAFTHDPDEIDYVAPGFQEFLAASLSTIAADPGEFIE